MRVRRLPRSTSFFESFFVNQNQCCTVNTEEQPVHRMKCVNQMHAETALSLRWLLLIAHPELCESSQTHAPILLVAREMQQIPT